MKKKKTPKNQNKKKKPSGLGRGQRQGSQQPEAVQYFSHRHVGAWDAKDFHSSCKQMMAQGKTFLWRAADHKIQRIDSSLENNPQSGVYTSQIVKV